jgi:hypothetical protein
MHGKLPIQNGAKRVNGMLNATIVDGEIRATDTQTRDTPVIRYALLEMLSFLSTRELAPECACNSMSILI